jgi:hypothetical protein
MKVRLLLGSISRLIAFFCLYPALCGDAQDFHRVRPSETDPAITNFDGYQWAYINTNLPSRGQLLVFLPGTFAEPNIYREFLKTAANLGMHSIGLTYVNDQIVDMRDIRL